jgi:hypothetical protein
MPIHALSYCSVIHCHPSQDWYLGSSWALGIATLGGKPYLNGRNQESSSESVSLAVFSFDFTLRSTLLSDLGKAVESF